MNAQRRAHYRHFRRLALEAVHYSVPARYCVVNILQCIFRKTESADTDLEVIEKTSRFLRRARHPGLEKKVIRNLAFVEWSCQEIRERRPKEVAAQMSAMAEYHKTIEELNRSCGILLS